MSNIFGQMFFCHQFLLRNYHTDSKILATTSKHYYSNCFINRILLVLWIKPLMQSQRGVDIAQQTLQIFTNGKLRMMMNLNSVEKTMLKWALDWCCQKSEIKSQSATVETTVPRLLNIQIFKEKIRLDNVIKLGLIML